MKKKIVPAIMLTFIALSSLVLFPIAFLIWIVTLPFDPRKKILHQFTCFWACLYLWVMPSWKLTLIGREKINKKKTYVIVSNHQSQLDILVAFRLFCHFKWISKIEVFRLPLIGWNMVLNQYVKLIRGDKESIKQMYARCEELIAQGNSIFIFPEGTRSPTGKLRPFKPGAFVLAKKMKVPILPVAINGTKEALPKYSMSYHGRQEITIEVLDEIPYERFKDMEVEELAELVRKIIGAHVRQPE